MKHVITQLNDLDLTRTYTYADYLTWHFDEMVELIKGKIFKMSPAPARLHQRVSLNLSGILYGKTRGKQCQVYSAPTDVRLLTKGPTDEEILTVVQPDIFIVCDPSKLDDRGCLGSPDFIAEILSPSSASKDLTQKFFLYQEAGVREYWVVYPGEETIHVFLLENESYINSGIYTNQNMIPVHTLDGIELHVSEIFEP